MSALPESGKTPGGPALRALSVEEVPALYKKCLRRDFPANERRPLAMITGPMKKGEYRCYAALAEGEMVGYALLAGRDGENVLLDYLAVEPGLRDAGWGGRIMTALRREIPAGHILIEAEAPDAAKTPEARALCLRRIAFYTRCGAVDLGLRWHLFGVVYAVLCLPPAGLAPLTPREGADAILALYGKMLLPSIPRTYRVEPAPEGPGETERR